MTKKKTKTMKSKLTMIFLMLGASVGLMVFGAQRAAGQNGNCSVTLNPEKIAFTSDRNGYYEVFTMNPDGSNPRIVSNNNYASTEPSISGEGSQIAYRSADGEDNVAEVFVVNADGTNKRRLTYSGEGGASIQPAFSHDGRRIAFVRNSGAFDIWVMNADGTNQTRLTNIGIFSSQPSFNRDGSRIVFTVGSQAGREIYIMNADGTNQIRLTDNAVEDGNPTFSPDGSRIAFTSTRDGNGEIYLMNLDGTNVTRVTDNAAFDAKPSFSPDGLRIAFQSNRDHINQEIYTMNLDGSNVTLLTSNTKIDIQPSWGGSAVDTDGDSVPDACDNCPFTFNPKEIAFVSNRDGNQEIYTMKADGSNPTRLTNNAAFDFDPALSRDGNRIAFTSFRDGSSEIYAMNSNGTNQTRLTNNAAGDGYPSFSPDGNRIAFFSDRDGNNEIYVMNADGTNPVRLTNNAGSDFNPKFSPDGSRIAFVSTRDGNEEIYVMNSTNGTNQIRLTNNTAQDVGPSFSPDGSQIAFVSSRDGNLNIYLMNAEGTSQIRLTNTATNQQPSFGGQADTDGDGIGNACENIPFVTRTTITSHAPNPSNPGQSVVAAFTVVPFNTVTHIPTGTVTVTDGVNSCTAAVASGQCVLPLSTYGNRVLTATYSGDAIFGGSVSPGVAHRVCTANLVVTNTNDSGAGSLREALVGVCPGGTISFSPIFNTAQTITLTGGELLVNGDVTVNGKGAQLLSINANNNGRAFRVEGGVVNLSGMKITGGNVSNDSSCIRVYNIPADYGGRITNEGCGGGIAHFGGDLTLTNVEVTGNRVTGFGAGILSARPLTIISSTISNNTANVVSTFTGGGIHLDYQSIGQSMIINSTISGNSMPNGSSDKRGGGIYSEAEFVFVINTTITNNFVPHELGSAGGIYSSSASVFLLRNSIVAGNNNTVMPDAKGFFSSASAYNLIGRFESSNAPSAANHNQVGTSASPINALLGNLTMNGGTTPTHALLPGSPAIDKGAATLDPAVTTDQRGAARPFDNPAIANQTGGDGSDIGAFEAQNAAPNAANDAFSVDEDSTLNAPAPGVLANDTDGENNPLTAILQTPPTNAAAFSLNANGSFSYTPTANFNGTTSFTYRASDGSVHSNTATVTITVNSVNDNPDAVNDQASAAANGGATIINVLANDTDVDSTVLRVVSVTNAANGAVAVTNGGANVSYTPNANFTGADSFTYTITDFNGGSDTATVSVTVCPANLVVSNTNDNGAGSLRQAIASVCPGGTISFAPAFNAEQTITLTGGELSINKDITINGAGANLLTVNANNTGRVFLVTAGNVNLSAMKITGGNASNGGSGGGIAHIGGNLRLTDVQVSGNAVPELGGGIYSNSPLTIVASTVSGNTANFVGGYAGGGIHNDGVLTIINSTVSGNSAPNSGTNGGGIFTGGTTTIINSTVTNNSAGGAGGVYNDGTTTVRNSIIAANQNNATTPDVFGGFDSSSAYNLIGNTGGTVGFTVANHNQTGTSASPLNPLLDVLGNYGGATPTHLLLPGSPAIDKGAAPLVPMTTDQRGVARPYDNLSIPNPTGGNGSDIGAFEWQQTPTAANASVAGRVSTGDGRGLPNVVVTMTDATGNTRVARTNPFGYFRFEEVEVGQTYVFQATAKRFTFNAQIITVQEDLTEVNFTAQDN